jgi:hypothetical protein
LIEVGRLPDPAKKKAPPKPKPVPIATETPPAVEPVETAPISSSSSRSKRESRASARLFSWGYRMARRLYRRRDAARETGVVTRNNGQLKGREAPQGRRCRCSRLTDKIENDRGPHPDRQRCTRPNVRNSCSSRYGLR